MVQTLLHREFQQLFAINTWQSLDGEGHQDDETGLKDFVITMSDIPSFNRIMSIFTHGFISKEQTKRTTNDDCVSVSDPDRIQIIIRAE